MIVEKLVRLPPWIEFQGCTFDLTIIINGSPDDVRLVYGLSAVSPESRHWAKFMLHRCWENPFADGSNQGFLFLAENISNDGLLLEAIMRCYRFLKQNNLL
jgi:hypothetical protein